MLGFVLKESNSYLLIVLTQKFSTSLEEILNRLDRLIIVTDFIENCVTDSDEKVELT